MYINQIQLENILRIVEDQKRLLETKFQKDVMLH